MILRCFWDDFDDEFALMIVWDEFDEVWWFFWWLSLKWVNVELIKFEEEFDDEFDDEFENEFWEWLWRWVFEGKLLMSYLI